MEIFLTLSILIPGLTTERRFRAAPYKAYTRDCAATLQASIVSRLLCRIYRMFPLKTKMQLSKELRGLPILILSTTHLSAIKPNTNGPSLTSFATYIKRAMAIRKPPATKKAYVGLTNCKRRWMSLSYKLQKSKKAHIIYKT